jgi:DNA-binding NtrC family response regulator
MSPPKILVVDDHRDLARGVALVLSPLPAELRVGHSAEEALTLLEQQPADLVLTDVRMPGKDGLTLLDDVRARWPRTRVILCTAFATIESAVLAMKRGAWDYLTKPFDNEELRLVVSRALKELRDEEEIAWLRAELDRRHCFHGLYSRDHSMRPVIETIRRVAPSPATVLVYGESGTGKEIVARALHAESPRSKGLFVAFNAAALPETLVESELFGSRRGAFTGADRDRKGYFLEADGGTLFIDELSSMPLSVQQKLLRTLQEREIVPVGSPTPVPVDVRIVAATNVDPRRLVREGLLRQDLYYRLSVVRLSIPPLRERIEDIALLAALFLERLAAPGQRPKQLGPAALRLLICHDWPGNVRELQNVMERAALLAAGDTLGPGDIALEDEELGWPVDDAGALPYEEAKRRALARFQRRYVEQVLEAAGGNISQAARTSGLTRAALHRILKRLGRADGLPEGEPGPAEEHSRADLSPEGDDL